MYHISRVFQKVTFLSLVFFTNNVLSANILPPPPEINAKGYVLMDYSTGHVIASGNPDVQLAPASLTKMMTSYIIGKELLSGNIKNDDQVLISENAWAKNFPDSSKMFIRVGTEVPVHLLNRGIVVSSGNDACVAMAEHIAGSESAFADMMNAYAEELGLSSTFFENSHGLDSQNHITTPRDMGNLAIAIVRDTPDEYALYKEKAFTYNKIKQYNRNSLLWDKSMNVDGMKTGHTSQAGYSLVTSATKGGMRLVSVVMGAESERARKTESKKLLTYGFRFFETTTPFSAGDTFTEARIWMGDTKNLRLGTLEDITVSHARGESQNIKAEIVLDTELVAPIDKGQIMGKVLLTLNGKDIASYPLVALNEVNEGGFFSKFIDWVIRLFSD